MTLLSSIPALCMLAAAELMLLLSWRWPVLAFPGTLLTVLACWLVLMAGGSLYEVLICLLLSATMMLRRKEGNG